MKNSGRAESRRKKPSAFFRLTKALFYAFLCLCVSLIAELWLSGLLPVWKETIAYPLLWVLPGLFALCAFLEGLSERAWLSALIWSGLCLSLVFCMAAVLFKPPAQLSQIRMVRDHTIQKSAQNILPIFENTERVIECEEPLYFETISGLPSLACSDQQQIAQIINDLPPVLKEKAAGIYFLTRATFNSMHEQNQADDIAGFTRMDNAAVVIKIRIDEADNYRSLCKNGMTLGLDDPYSYQETLVHELVHLLDVQTIGATAWLSERQDWLDLYGRYQNVLGEYAASSPAEFFAEAGVYYFLYPQLLMDLSPEIYTWFETNALQEEHSLSQGFFCEKNGGS